MNTYEVKFYKRLFQWRWKVVSRNGRIIGASTESFWNKGDCEYNARLLSNSLYKHFEF